MKLQLNELNRKIDELEAKATEVKEDARDKYKEEMGKLRHQSKLAVAKLDELKAAGEDKWDAMVAETDKIRDAFTHSFNYFKSQL
jgi:predicted RNase H-like nuclease